MSIDTSKVARSNTTAAVTRPPGAVARTASWADDRLGLAKTHSLIRKVFPDHWSFMLGEVALWNFVVLLVSGVFLTLWFDPSMSTATYNGSYTPLRGLEMSEAMISTLDITFEVRGGLLMRQIHHWSAMLFIAGMLIHLLRVFLTGAHRKPREVTWVVGVLMLLLGTFNGFLGYSLPDDLLSGTGVRAFDGFVKSIPVIGTYASYLVFGGEFPGDQLIPRFYVLHILLLPALLVVLVSVHLILIVYHKHTQWPGPGKTAENVVGYPFLPVYTAKAGAFFMIIFGFTALMGATMQINPLWLYGPYDPSKVTAGSQPDWYMGWPDGALRIMPGWESEFLGITLSWNVFLPIIVLPGLLFTLLLLLPFIETWITGDKREHHLLERPRNAPTRTATMMALVTFYGVLWAAAGNDLIAIKLHLSINQITYFFRVAVFLLPVLAFVITRRWCIALQRKDRDDLVHGYETGVIMRAPDGGYTEPHRPLPVAKAYTLSVRDGAPTNGTGPHGAERPKGIRARLRAAYFADNVPVPTAEELEHVDGHADHQAITGAGSVRGPGEEQH